MPYSAEQITDFGRSFNDWAARKRVLVDALLTRAYREERSRVLAAQGITRRLRTLIRCIEQVYELIPPETETPSRQCIDDAAIWLQAFVINVYGTLDNLARLWVWEADVKYRGKPVPNMYIGLTPKSTAVLGSLSISMREYLFSAGDWFKYLENYRHALAHRIPLYIPPKQMNEAEAIEWRFLETKSLEALKACDTNLYDELAARQSKIGTFMPCMMHSFGRDDSDGTPVRFHGQMICDLSTVVEIGEKILDELNSIP